MLKTIGIIGGMGPAATADLMMKIADMTEAECDQKHIPVLTHTNTSIPDRTAAILHGGADPVPELTRSAKLLESMGADFLIVPCNTAHYFIPQVQPEVNIPILNMPVSTAKLLKKRGVSKAAILATDGTIQAGIYDKALKDEGVEPMYPDAEQQKMIMSLIYDYVKAGITEFDKLPVQQISDLCDDLRTKGAEALILACTELPVGFELMNLEKDDCMDATKVLAATAIREAGATVKSRFNY